MCVDYVGFEGDPYGLAEASDLVIVGEVLGPDGVAPYNVVNASAYTVRVDGVLKGEVSASEIRVISIPDGCMTEGEPAVYTGGDQLDFQGRAQFFLSKTGGGMWTTLTPSEGVERLGVDGELYWDPDVPSPTPTPTP